MGNAKAGSRKVARSAVSGRFVTPEQAVAAPSLTVVEGITQWEAFAMGDKIHISDGRLTVILPRSIVRKAARLR